MKDNSLENSLSLTLIESGKRSISGFSVPSVTVAIFLPTVVDGFEFLSSVERRDALKLFWIFLEKKHFFLDLAITAFIFWLLFAGDKNSSTADFMWNNMSPQGKVYQTLQQGISTGTHRCLRGYWSNWIIFSLPKEKPCQRALARTETFLRFPSAAPARMGVTESEAGRARGRGREQGVLATWRKR